MNSVEQASAVCIVVDRAHSADAEKFCREMDGGWTTGINAWLPWSDMRFVVLLAYNRMRIARRAPLLLLAKDEEALCQAIQYSCTQLDDVTCAWVKFVEERIDGLIGPIILADLEIKGTA